MPFPSTPERDRPWVMRAYAGHSSQAESNALYRRNLAKGQTGLAVAFDLPTQTGYAPDHELAPGEGGKGGVPRPPHTRPAAHPAPSPPRPPADHHEHVDDDQRPRDVAAGALPGRRPR